MRLIKLVLRGVGLALVALVVVLLFNTWWLGSRQASVSAVASPDIDAAAATRRLSGAITIKTISFAPGLPPPAEEFRRFHTYLASSFPRAHASLKLETIGGLSLLYSWPGSDPAAQPIILMAHQDVVPIAPGTESQWSHLPFSGDVADGFVWGRGAWDDKGAVVAILEAVELLLRSGFQPKATVYLVFGHDEEIGGQGARAVAEVLRQRNVKAAFALDEGLLVTEGIIAGIAAPTALIGVAEKGYATLSLTALGTPGHSSMPPARTAIGTLAKALATLEANPFPADLAGLARSSYEGLAPEFSGLRRVLLSNLWLTAPVVRRVLEAAPSTNAMMRTTTALTVIKAGDKDNVLPGVAEAIVNFRIRPGDTIAGVVARTKALVGPDVGVAVAPGASEASAVSSSDGRAYRAIEKTIREVFPNALVVPGLMLGATDGRHMAGVAENVYRFSPVRAGAVDLSRFHGTNERIAVSNYVEMIHFYHRLLSRID